MVVFSPLKQILISIDISVVCGIIPLIGPIPQLTRDTFQKASWAGGPNFHSAPGIIVIL